MIYLRTGSNGACKSLFTLKDVREMQLKESRPVCIVRGRLKVYEKTMNDFGWKWIDFKDWEAQEDGSIILADECHNDLPLRPASAPVPPHIAKLAEHRARGMDFFLLTQHPMNIDAFVRRLIGAPGYHQHLKRIAGGSSVTNVLQWDAVKSDCEKDGSGKGAQVTTRVQPKEVYEWYDSMSLDTSKVRIPFQLKALVVMVLVIPVVGWFAFQKMQPKDKAPDQVASAVSVLPVASVASGGKVDKVLTAGEYASSFKPRIDGLAFTAPRYDEATKPVNVPYPAACLSMGDRCSCYSQQATRLEVPKALCVQIVKGGYFNDWQAAIQAASRSSAVVDQPVAVATGSRDLHF
jgi:zona occludens toxin